MVRSACRASWRRRSSGGAGDRHESPWAAAVGQGVWSDPHRVRAWRGWRCAHQGPHRRRSRRRRPGMCLHRRVGDAGPTVHKTRRNGGLGWRPAWGRSLAGWAYAAARRPYGTICRTCWIESGTVGWSRARHSTSNCRSTRSPRPIGLWTNDAPSKCCSDPDA